MERKKRAKVVERKAVGDTSVPLVRKQVDTDIYGRPVWRWVKAKPDAGSPPTGHDE